MDSGDAGWLVGRIMLGHSQNSGNLIGAVEDSQRPRCKGIGVAVMRQVGECIGNCCPGIVTRRAGGDGLKRQQCRGGVANGLAHRIFGFSETDILGRPRHGRHGVHRPAQNVGTFMHGNKPDSRRTRNADQNTFTGAQRGCGEPGTGRQTAHITRGR